jgi:hypothetical protein
MIAETEPSGAGVPMAMNTRIRRSWLVVALLSLVLAIAACTGTGGGGGSAAPAVPAGSGAPIVPTY